MVWQITHEYTPTHVHAQMLTHTHTHARAGAPESDHDGVLHQLLRADQTSPTDRPVCQVPAEVETHCQDGTTGTVLFNAPACVPACKRFFFVRICGVVPGGSTCTAVCTSVKFTRTHTCHYTDGHNTVCADIHDEGHDRRPE